MTSTAPAPDPNPPRPSGVDGDRPAAPSVAVAGTELASVKVDGTLTDKPADSPVKPEKPDEADKKGGRRGRPNPAEMVPYFSLFRYASPSDKILMVIGSICAAANGTVMPLYAILLGNLINALAMPGDTFKNVLPYSLYLFLLGIGSLFVSAFAYSFWSITAQKQVKIVREQYLISVLRQEIGWWDAQSPGELSGRLAADSDQIENAIGTSVPACIQHLSRFTTGLIVGFIYGWQLALLIIGISPILVGVGGMMGKFMASMASISTKAYGQAGAVAEEALTSMRTVSAFNAEKQELARFDTKLTESLVAGEKRAKATGALFGTIMFVMFGSYSISFWFGAQLIAWGTINGRTGKPFTGGDILSTFFGMLIGSFSLGQLAPYIPDFTNGRAAGYRIFQVINRISKIDATSTDGKKLDSVKGEIEFRNVKFSYPTRMDSLILKGTSLRILPGQTVALVGESGSGKSTCIGLIERFYDPLEGSVIIDGEHDLKSLSIRDWRQHVGLVGQMPILFQGSIRENIKYGKPSATEEEIVAAAKLSNAHAFIMALPDKYDTTIGGFGSEFLSGGQKQRIAIARALIKKPRILLLDEATSALDNESEKVVQKALDELMTSETGKNMTCFVIAHRLSTIRNADNIFVFSKGEIVESGTHDQLIANSHGVYSTLVKSQGAAAHDEKEEKKDDEHKLEPVVVAERRNSSSKKQVNRRGSASKSHKEPSRSQHVPLEPPIHTQDSEPQADDETAELAPEDEDDEDDNVRVPTSYVWRMITPNFAYAFCGFLASAGAGVVQPVFGVVMSEMISVFYQRDIEQLKKDAGMNAIYFLLIALGNFIMLFTQSYGLGVVGERLTKVLRFNVFRSLLRQEITFFDNPKNSAGVLATRLSVDSEQVRKITSDWVGQLCQVIICAAGGLVIAYITNWRMALLLTGFAPFIVLSGLGHMLFMKQKGAKKAFEQAGSVASEAITGIHTVVSFTSEDIILKRFADQLMIPLKAGIRSGFVTGTALGGSELLLFVAYAGSLLFGAHLIEEKLTTFTEVVRVFFCVVLSFQNIGRIAERLPDIHKSTKALRAVYALETRKSAIDHEDARGESVDTAQGSIAFKDVRFRYPSRPDAVVLQQFNLEIQPGKTTALVGFSGSGKSTVIQLLERFYDPEGGYVQVGGSNLANLNVKNWRSLIGYVGQEPVLFNLTIKENILYGKPNATDEEVMDAAKKANVMEFVGKLPNGLDTPVGSRGGQISGGQRQRVAIARALIRDPQILLLDEATSALDNESERLIQEALDRLMKNRTTVVIAHRLSTIRNADTIVVMSQGKVVEVGNHESLMNKAGGVYAQLVAAGAGGVKH